MTLPKSLINIFKHLKPMEDDIFEVHPRFAPKLIELGLIKEAEWIEEIKNCVFQCNAYQFTDKGEMEYLKWLEEQK
jgi:hypothetical protein